jgi:hypothetical protein
MFLCLLQSNDRFQLLYTQQGVKKSSVTHHHPISVHAIQSATSYCLSLCMTYYGIFHLSHYDPWPRSVSKLIKLALRGAHPSYVSIHLVLTLNALLNSKLSQSALSSFIRYCVAVDRVRICVSCNSFRLKL